MVVAAVVLAAVWFLTAFVLRIAIHVRRTGDTGLRANAGAPLSPAWWARVVFTLAVVAVAAAPALVAWDVVEVVDAVDRPGLRWAGLAVAIAGVAATFWAQLAMGSSWRIGVDPGERTELVTGGPFAVVRNPIFSAMGVTALGLALMAPTAFGLAALLLLLAALQVQVRAVEEPYLRAVHGSAFDEYAARVGRFVPRLGLHSSFRRRDAAPPSRRSAS